MNQIEILRRIKTVAVVDGFTSHDVLPKFKGLPLKLVESYINTAVDLGYLTKGDTILYYPTSKLLNLDCNSDIRSQLIRLIKSYNMIGLTNLTKMSENDTMRVLNSSDLIRTVILTLGNVPDGSIFDVMQLFNISERDLQE